MIFYVKNYVVELFKISSGERIFVWTFGTSIYNPHRRYLELVIKRRSLDSLLLP